MNVYRIAVVEDEKEQADNLKKILSQYAESKGYLFDISVYDGGEDFLSDALRFDLAFLDIDLSGSVKNDAVTKSQEERNQSPSDNDLLSKNGMVIAAELLKRGLCVPVVFVTNLVMYAVDGYSVGALDFIVKPVSYESLSIKMDRIVKKAFRSKNAITLRIGATIRKIPVDTIKYVEVRGHKLTVHTLDGNYDAYVPLSEITKQTDGTNFVRCNVCYLVNLSFVTGMDGNVVCLGNESVTVSRGKKKEFVTALNRFLGGNL